MERGQIIEKGSEKWLVRVYLGRVNGKRQYVSKAVSGSRKDAEKALTEMLFKMDGGALLAPTKVTTKQHVQSWLDTKLDIEPRTRADYQHRMDKDVFPFIGDVKLQALTPVRLRFLCASLLSERELGPRTVQYTFTVLRQALQQAVNDGLINKNPCDGVSLPSLPKPQPKVLSPEDTVVVLKATEGDPLHALWRLLLTSGLRPGEALALHWSDVLPSGAVAVRDGKTDAAARLVELPESTLACLRAHRVAQAERMGLGVELVFATASGAPLDLSNVRKAWKAACEKAGVGEHQLYDTRRTHLTHLLELGMHQKAVAARAGQASPEVLLKHYAAARREVDRSAAEKTEQLLLGASA